MIVQAKALFTCTRSSAKILYALRLTVSSWHLDKSSLSCPRTATKLSLSWREDRSSTSRIDGDPCDTKTWLPVVPDCLSFATCSQQKLPKTRATKSEKKAKTQGSVLKHWMFPANPHAISKSETGQLNEILCDAQTACAFKTDVSNRVTVAYTCKHVLRCRLLSTALRCFAAV